ncbi:MAG: hypothetical protein A3D24_02050 [Candidatus Blackburnbacteria bacterium RIFCSPHIGHO2_02_FULL_39_13]|uniref:DUF4012 domain-containing protein n=1 Tax=Candidatus Blackburnbacteria bacterium RIFCSPLOWO2_01_FULL_40_20 TaxID=1797519 RepID=A0A1G1VEF9_9BACT|nr:MAG: hypothetical protein UT38_C0001G0028 [Microgenomates group bacterium GW2011_GWA2_39_19]OGY06929.1 MAG: hypothetical protein A2694_04070 [Candidatus Blackburnbacteria bacterium RIFCSPHIGHO2_01_FULL_40_17]OGY09181.1 MAG: hypothetical protein A3D24_02050 [Candidatus Blackburnbacteria bacterium RIFCSPHIGHO2_02_FULL_39_13]OGY13582.1 MAG: hypothetical protein A3A77_04305 [Candidatus Blackburnbacteria bacterium RIFCSPLOWO2_01_FULL_40_20]HBL52234.1 hypothetical protein [Candidatus Blackburnbact
MDKLKKIKTDVITPEAQDAGFHSFPSEDGKGATIHKKTLGIVGGALLAPLVFLGIFAVLPGLGAYNSAKTLMVSAKELQDATQSQDLDKMTSSLSKVKSDLQALDGNMNRLGWIKVVPYFGSYIADAQSASRGGLAGIEAGEIIIKTAEPYSDILGLNGGEQALDGTQTAEDRINFIVETVESIVPQLDSISAKTGKMVEEFDKIDPNRYPEYFQGKPVRKTIREGKEMINSMHELVTGGKPVLEKAPYLLGIDNERTYLLLFQNDKELRPTGGFMTAYAIVKVKNGKFEQVASNDIYNLDNKLKNKAPAPEAIKKYLPLVNTWNMRDMNLSPDFKVSMDTFKESYDKTKSPQVDGIVALDTALAVEILRVMGGIGVPGFGNFYAEDNPRCNCPGVIYELESYADVAGPIVWDDISGKIVYKPPHSDNRKAILGPLMNSILANAMGQPKEKIPGLFQAGFNSLLEKHVLFYFGESDVQKAMESFNLAGRIKDYPEGDYLHINDTNFAGAKSNLYVQQEVALSVEPGKDGNTNTLTIKYKNPQKADGWLNGVYRDWVRVYVPKGSTIIDSTGSEVAVTTSEDLGKTVFEGFFTLRPEGVEELKFKYKTPVTSKDGYKILVQKQSGTNANPYTVSVNGQKEDFNLKTDKEFRF